MLKKFINLLNLILLISILGACGVRGDLYLPEKNTESIES